MPEALRAKGFAYKASVEGLGFRASGIGSGFIQVSGFKLYRA